MILHVFYYVKISKYFQDATESNNKIIKAQSTNNSELLRTIDEKMICISKLVKYSIIRNSFTNLVYPECTYYYYVTSCCICKLYLTNKEDKVKNNIRKQICRICVCKK